jgi:hypothetical protein
MVPGELLDHREFGRVVGGPEGDVMDGAAAGAPRQEVSDLADLHDPPLLAPEA